MRCCSLFCVVICLNFVLIRIAFAAGIEVAANAEKLIESCDGRNIVSSARCLNYNLNQKWKYELDYAGKAFSALGRFDEIKKSILGNLFAFVKVDQYQVSCRVTERYAEALKNIATPGRVLITGVLESYHITFNLRSFHHLRLTPYCSIESVV
jgi:hypothetical protein